MGTIIIPDTITFKAFYHHFPFLQLRSIVNQLSANISWFNPRWRFFILIRRSGDLALIDGISCKPHAMWKSNFFQTEVPFYAHSNVARSRTFQCNIYGRISCLALNIKDAFRRASGKSHYVWLSFGAARPKSKE